MKEDSNTDTPPESPNKIPKGGTALQLDHVVSDQASAAEIAFVYALGMSASYFYFTLSGTALIFMLGCIRFFGQRESSKRKKKRNRARRGSLDPNNSLDANEADDDDALPGEPEPSEAILAPQMEQAAIMPSECVICTDAVADHVLVPCGHKCICADCGDLLKTGNQPCPMCRAEIRDAIKVFET